VLGLMVQVNVSRAQKVEETIEGCYYVIVGHMQCVTHMVISLAMFNVRN